MSKFYFYTDIDLLNVQTAAAAFGPVVGSEPTQYRVTSLHQTNAPARAFAVCDGQVAIQPFTGNASLVNLILKPAGQISDMIWPYSNTEDPETNTRNPINFTAIKYIIYRGLTKESLLLDDNNIASESKNDLTKKAKIFQDDINSKATPPVVDVKPSSNALGWDSRDKVDTTLIDDIFYKPDNPNFQLLSIKGGDTIGTFQAGTIGIEIILDNIRNNPTLEIARKTVNTIEVTPIPTSASTQEQKLLYRTKKEEVLNYMDPCAFYGSLYRVQILYKASSQIDTAEFSKTFGIGIYSNILDYVSPRGGKIFNNRNIIYIDIRNDYNRSFNYMKNYSDIITLGSTKKNYYDISKDVEIDWDITWPILSIDPTLYSSETVIKGNNKILKLNLSITANISENKNPLIYIEQGYVDNKTDINNIPNSPKGEGKFLKNSYTDLETNLVTSSVTLQMLMASNSPISNYICLKYIKNDDPDNNISNPSSGSVHRAQHFLDNVFLPLKMKTPFSNASPLKVEVFNEDRYIFSNSKTFIASVGYSVESVGSLENTVTLFAFSKELSEKPEDKFNNQIGLTGGLFNNQYLTSYLNNKFGYSSFKKGHIIDTSITPIVDVDYITIEDLESGKPFNAPELETEFISITLKKTSFEAMCASSGLLIEYDIFLTLRADSVKANDNNGIIYSSYEIVLKGYEIDGANVVIGEYPTGIIVYGRDTSLGKTLVLTEDGANIDSLLPNDNYTCKNIPNEIIISLYNYINDALKVSLDPATKKLYEMVFDDTKTAYIKINPDYTIDYTHNVDDISLGYLAEACTHFTIYRFTEDLRKRRTDSSTEIYQTLKKTLIRGDNGNGKEFGFDEPITETEKNNFNKLLNPLRYFGNYNINYITVEDNDGYDGEALTNGISNCLLSYMYEGYTGSTSSSLRYSSYPKLDRSSKASFISPAKSIIKFHLEMIRNEVTRLVLRDSSCLYHKLSLGKNPPENLILATGDGTSTKGLFGVDDYGIILFNYQYLNYAKINTKNSHSFKATISPTVTVHLNIFGLNASAGNPSLIILKKDGVLCCFYTDFTNGLNPVNYDIYNDFSSNRIFITQSQDLRTLINNEIGTGTGDGVAFYENSNEMFMKSGSPIALYDSAKNDINYYTRSEITVILISGDKYGDPDESLLMVNVVEGKSDFKSIVLDGNNLYNNNIFEITPDKFNELLTPLKKIEDFDALINNLVSSIQQNHINLNLRGNYVGVSISRAEDGKCKVKRDIKYMFNHPNRLSETGPVNSADYNERRYSFAQISFDILNLFISIDSFVSPAKSDLNNELDTMKDPEIVNFLDSFTRSVVLGDLSEKLYNPILSALRSFGFLYSIRTYIINRAPELGKTPDEINLITSKLDTAFNTGLVHADLNLGIGKEITYSDYIRFRNNLK